MGARSRTEGVFANEADFLDAARSSIRNFKFESGPVKNGHFSLKVAEHTASKEMKVKEWKPFRRRERRSDAYEGPVIAVTDFLIREFNCRTIYDIGAGNGFHTFMAASVEGCDATVHAFEMQPFRHRSVAGIAASVPEVHGRIFAHLAGLSDHHEGERTIWFTRRKLYESKPDPRAAREAWHRRLKYAWLGQENLGTLREATVSITTVDRFAQENDASPDLIKLDVDGYEAKVIPGARQTLASKPFIIFELHKDELLARFAVTRRDVVAPLFDEGYRAARFTDHNCCQTCDLIKAERDDPSFDRQATTMYLFY